MEGEQEADRDQSEYEWWREKTNTKQKRVEQKMQLSHEPAWLADLTLYVFIFKFMKSKECTGFSLHYKD
jgi:hypothetical protein